MPATRTSHRGPIGVLGLWHLGSVTAACLAEAGYAVIGVDPDAGLVAELREGRPPVAEPGLAELLVEYSTRLHFSADVNALSDAACAWVAFDTPVDDNDVADVDWVLERSAQMLAALPADELVVVSSQLPVGSVARLRERCAAARGEDSLRFACLPENLRLGQALDAFRAPDRIVAGVRDERDRSQLSELLASVPADVQWMSVESAEMTKHALNGFLATSVAFINEVAVICEAVGADAAEVSRGLKSECRIGPGAYLAPGGAFAGGTLARDVGFLRALAESHGLPASVFAGVAAGNAAHERWPRRKLGQLVHDGGGPQRGDTVGVWGLTYKPGTDTLRRSSAVELCGWLVDRGVSVRAHDPAVTRLPAGLAAVQLCDSPLQAAEGADALVVCTAWPLYREVDAGAVANALRGVVVIDAAGFLLGSLGSHPGMCYARVGSPQPEHAHVSSAREVSR
ncbi:MAG TPA: nucleotide sugar dehydrogenase [Solirubrobacteraceae bacterium]|nr:nucleotide sugar dehydrogenase [Solirubrobacteraceae bacterium]